jgi:hypothetical protein
LDEAEFALLVVVVVVVGMAELELTVVAGVLTMLLLE